VLYGFDPDEPERVMPLYDPAMSALYRLNGSVAAINVREVAELLGVNARTIWRMSQRGEIPAPIRLGQRVVRWRLSYLREYLDRKAGGGMAVSRASSAGRGACR
jgi:excisionase family DNA binding protein